MPKSLTAALCVLLMQTIGFSQVNDSSLSSWQANKFSMFIHFGLYSELGGVWKGEKVTRGYSEQIQSHRGIFSDEYEQVAKHFNPTNWNADSIAILAKEAGMKSIVITTKHHDGFCMFDTKTTDFNVVKASPYGKDIVGELAKACRKHGLNLGLYFSLIDWHYPQAYPISSHNADFITDEHHAYNKKQIEELLTNYGPISEMWFDMGSLTYQQSEEIRTLVKSLQTNCLTSGRLGNDMGDFCVMGDNSFPDYHIQAPWQVPASMFDETWGYRSWQELVPIEEKLHQKLLSLIKTVARGGNYILNVGPKGDGSLTAFETAVLHEMGKWLNIHGEAIYGTNPAVLSKSITGVETTVKGNTLYAFLTEKISPETYRIEPVSAKVKSIHVLGNVKQKIAFSQKGNVLSLEIPETIYGNEALPVIRISCEGEPKFQTEIPLPLNQTLSLSSNQATPAYSFSGIDYYSSYRSTVKYEWAFSPAHAGKLKAVVNYTGEEVDRKLELSFNGVKIPVNFDGGEAKVLSPAEVQWKEAFICGPVSGFIDQLEGPLTDIDVHKNWGKHDWQAAEKQETEVSFQKETNMFQSWYWMQKIDASSDTKKLIRLTLNDGLAVYLNGEEVYTVNRSGKDSVNTATVLLNLKKGSNVILLKFFNRFDDHVKLGIFSEIPQVIYQRSLPVFDVEKSKTYHFSLQLSPNSPVHQHLRAPNFSIELNLNR